MPEVIVVGGGAAGMMAAIAAAECGARVTLFEKNEKLGKKLFITGKGRCNFTNDCAHGDFLSAIVSNPRFLYSSFDAFDNHDLILWMEKEGLRVKHERGGRVFPASDKSSDVIKTLQKALEKRGVKIRLNTCIKELIFTNKDEDKAEAGPASDTGADKKADKCRGVILSDGERIRADAVIVATGGLSYPSTGSTGDGYRWASSADLAVRPCRPSLVAFTAVFADGRPVAELAGLSLKNVGVRVSRRGKVHFTGQGEMLFTHTGVSGPLMLTASTRIAPTADEPAALKIDWKPALTLEQVEARLLREFDAAKNRELHNVMGALLPSGAIDAFLAAAAVPRGKTVHEATRQERRRIAETLKAFPLTLTGLCGYNEAVITQGGVSVREVAPATMECRKVRGLYFAGEVLDLDAVTGGYNLQIAWTTGAAAGRAAASCNN